MSEWTTLLSVEAGAAATLMGLVFVSLSINLNMIMSIPGLPRRALESILQFLEVFLIATVLLIPGQSERVLGGEIAVLGAAFWLSLVTGQIQYLLMKTGHPEWWFVNRAVLGQLAGIPFCIAGITLLLGVPGAIYWLVPGFVFSFVSGVVSAWVLLVEILR
jgi:modulator of FtsH protease